MRTHVFVGPNMNLFTIAIMITVITMATVIMKKKEHFLFIGWLNREGSTN
jgi:hypothetical protein